MQNKMRLMLCPSLHTIHLKLYSKLELGCPKLYSKYTRMMYFFRLESEGAGTCTL